MIFIGSTGCGCSLTRALLLGTRCDWFIITTSSAVTLKFTKEQAFDGIVLECPCASCTVHVSR
ncbi:hypothetical protein PR003_g3897 [Phytophthora rubi]|uniref:Uncharacterized protein n=1 Tax=Phytophthora rubi TaxID=129364 RepID=A0A6A4FWH7_9STRA|nr:hypothetical protein PR003_g3897 [Phytophthora rubi]